MPKFIQFPKSFLWGVATSAYQIEGAAQADGKGASIWDTFVRRRRAIADGSTGDKACDHYRCAAKDVKLMAKLGISAYRFSLSWPRLFPEGRGQINEKGMDFYRRLVADLRAHGIEPIATLYHWDLPQSLEKEGGWGVRRTAGAFAEYAAAVARELNGQVRWWLTINEPLSVVTHGYLVGDHAPGRRNPLLALRVAHHLLLAHGLATEAIRAEASGVQVGLANSYYPYYPRRAGPMKTTGWVHALGNRTFTDPIVLGVYPEPFASCLRLLQPGLVQAGDLAQIAQPLDFLGVNYYSRLTRSGPWRAGLRRLLPLVSKDKEHTSMGWESYPEGFYDLLVWLRSAYPGLRFLITENGAAYSDSLQHGRVRDLKRIAFIRSHLRALHRAMLSGTEVLGYCYWSLLDNFEWAHGYTQRFGLVGVKHTDGRRFVKASGQWYARVCRTGQVEVK
jgi:beta-glucosidase